MDIPSGRLLVIASAMLLGAGLVWMTNSFAESVPSRGGSVASPAIIEADDSWTRVSPPTGEREVVPEAEQPRPRLRSVSTAPLRPRLADGLPGATSPPAMGVWNPRVRIEDAQPGVLDHVLATPGVRFATRYHTAELTVHGDDREDTLRVAFVDPARFRVLTPRVTAEAGAAWQAVADGGLLLTHEAGRALRAGPGDEVRVSDGDERADVTVAAWVSLGRAQVADAVMSAAAMPALMTDARSGMLVALGHLAEADAVADRLAAAGIGAVEPVPGPVPYRAELVGHDAETVAAFEAFTFVPAGGGAITIDDGWVERNITKARVPILGEVACHRLMIPQLTAALAEIEAAGLAGLIDPDDYGGCFNPRHIGRDPTRSLSMHAWGLGIDVNVHTNLLGRPPQLDGRIVEIFEAHGFNWGGNWRQPDGMHFELGVLLEAP